MILRKLDTGTLRSLVKALRAMFFHNFLLSNPRQLVTLFSFPPCSVWHTTQRWSQLVSILTGCKCDYYITHTYYLPQVCLNTNYSSITVETQLCLTILTRCQSFCPVHLSSVWNIIKFDFSSLFLCCCSANKNNKHGKPRQFAIRTIFQDKCCNFWQNCKGAYIFGHDCNLLLLFVAFFVIFFIK